jgi:hypothetical protein
MIFIPTLLNYCEYKSIINLLQTSKYLNEYIKSISNVLYFNLINCNYNYTDLYCPYNHIINQNDPFKNPGSKDITFQIELHMKINNYDIYLNGEIYVEDEFNIINQFIYLYIFNDQYKKTIHNEYITNNLIIIYILMIRII